MLSKTWLIGLEISSSQKKKKKLTRMMISSYEKRHIYTRFPEKATAPDQFWKFGAARGVARSRKANLRIRIDREEASGSCSHDRVNI